MTAPLCPLQPITPVGARLCATIDSLGSSLAEAAAYNDRTAIFAHGSLRVLREAGILAACAPTTNGGANLVSLYDLAILCSRIAEHDASLAIGLSMHLALSWYFLRTQLADPMCRDAVATRAWLRQVGRGDMIVCSAVAEAAPDPGGPKTLARREGNSWRINGEKLAVSLSPAATHFYTRVTAETHDGPWQGTIMIPRSTSGVTVLDDWSGMGLRGSGSGRVRFSDVALPLEDFLPRGPWGSRVSDEAGRAANSIVIVAVYAGVAEAAFAIAYRELLARGAEALTSTASRAGHAELELQMVTLRAALQVSLEYLDKEITSVPPRSHLPAMAATLLTNCAAAGMVIERAAMQAVQLAMQLCGAKSYSTEATLARLYRDVRAAGFMRPYSPIEGWMDLLIDTRLKNEAFKAQVPTGSADSEQRR